jgi:NDP-sugar pyrophosphorylase family protein
MPQLEAKPPLEHWIDQLRAFGVHKVVIHVRFLAHRITKYFGFGAGS